MSHQDVIVIGAGASGLYCAATAGYRGRSVLVLEHSRKVGRKVLMSGGGRCNFTNLHNGPSNFVSDNPHFCKSALSRLSVNNFVEQVERHGIDYHEKTLGQLFCDKGSKAMLNMLLTECEWAQVRIETEAPIANIEPLEEGGYKVQSAAGDFTCESLVIATGGLSIPHGGATDFAFVWAKHFGLEVTPLRAALVPFTLDPDTLEFTRPLAGVSHRVEVSSEHGTSFIENMLFTHRGISGPAILQISSYWQPGQAVYINLFPELDCLTWLKEQREQHPKSDVVTQLGHLLTKRMAQQLCSWWQIAGRMADFSNAALEQLAEQLTRWKLIPAGTEGYRTAEVTLGGIATTEVNQKTFEAKKQPGLYFIGECLDVTGQLGGHNFQWAWASGFCAGQAV